VQRGRLLGAAHGAGVLPAGGGRGAPLRDGAGGAVGGARGADAGTEFHHGLVVVAGGSGRDEGVGERIEQLPDGGVFDRGVDVEQAGEDADDVAVDHGDRFAEGDAGDRGGGVGADAGERAETGGRLGEASAAVRHDAPRAGVEVPGAGVVAQPFPVLEHLVIARPSQGLDRGEGFEEAFVVRRALIDARLLEDDLGQPDGVGVLRAAPGQVARGAAIPCEQGLAEWGSDGRGAFQTRMVGHGCSASISSCRRARRAARSSSGPKGVRRPAAYSSVRRAAWSAPSSA